MALTLILSGCQSTLPFDSVDSVKKLSNQVRNANNLNDAKAIAQQIKISQDLIKADLKVIQALYKNLEQKVSQKWGKKDTVLPNKKRYVKYVNNYQARTQVDFEKGVVRVETIANKTPIVVLKDAIITTLLTTADPSKTNIFSSSEPDIKGVPFLSPQVRDQDGVIVQYRWRAERYANYLVTNKTQQIQTNGKTIHFVEFSLVQQHQHLRQEKYSDYVLAAADRYNLEPALIYGIIETESSFNPYAVSPANAYGLMQVVPATAGKDVYNLIKKRSGEPTKETLFQPEKNIDIGSAYLHILQTRYLVKVTNKTSQEYSMISAYNGGAGNVLKTFDTNRSVAISKINQNPANSVYQKLRYDHPRSESQYYLEKVTQAKKNYE